jgi:serine/threonine-protein kinase
MPISLPVELPSRYRDPRHLANGGMAAVYAAEDAMLGRRVAVKVLAAHFAEDPAAMRRFQREARAAARVSQHPHVVTIYDVGEHAGCPFIVMELREGGSLAQLLREGVPARADALRWVAEAASALDAAHALDIVHRDVKPGNLLLDGQRRLGVADFGIARLAYESAVTLTGQVLGTAAYVAPEQAAGQGATAASDRYALAVVAHELLTGQRPFTGGTLAAQARQHAEADPTPASAHDPDLPAAVDGVLARALAKDPGARWETASDFATALARAAGEDATEATRPLAAAPPDTEPITAPAGTRPPAGAGAASPPERPPSAGTRAGAGSSPKRPLAAGAVSPPRRPLSEPSSTRRGRGRSRRWLPFALVAVLLALIAVFAVASSGGRSNAVSGFAATVPPPAPGEEAAPAQPSQPAGPATGISDLNDQGFNLMDDGRYDEAIPLLQRAVDQCGDSRETVCAYALFNLGHSLRLAGRPADAIPILQRRLDYDNQTDAVQAELEAAQREAGQGTTAPAPGADHSREGSRGDGKEKGRGKGADEGEHG